MKRIEQEGKQYHIRIEGMLEASHATPHPATRKSLYELMFGRKMQLGILLEISKFLRMEIMMKLDEMMLNIS